MVLYHAFVGSKCEYSLSLHDHIPVTFNNIRSLNRVVKLSKNQLIQANGRVMEEP
jgi:hypothetical protein